MRRPVCLFAVLFTAAVWLSVLISPPQASIGEQTEGRYVTLRGTVEERECAVREESGEQYIRITLGDAVLVSGVPGEGAFEINRGEKILCTIEKEPEEQKKWAQIGAVILVRGKIRLYKRPSNEGEFDAFMYYSAIGGYLFNLSDARILSYSRGKDPVRTCLYDIRDYLSDTLDQICADKHGVYGEQCASVMKAMLLGQNSLVDRQVKEKYQAAGIIHVICVSGLHISMIGAGISAFLHKCGAPAGVCSAVSVLTLYFYGLLTGMHTSCIRALIMFGMREAAKAMGRTYDMLTAMAVAAVLLLIEQPLYIYHSGFLFSFAAVAAAGILMPVMKGGSKPFAIPLFTLPVNLYFYYTFPLYSIVLNLIVISMAPFLMVGGGAALAVGAAAGMLPSAMPLRPFLEAIARIAAELPVLILWIFEKLCDLTQMLPFNILTAGRPPDAVIAAYYLLLAISTFAAQIRAISERKVRILRAALCAAAVVLIFRVRYQPPMALYMLDVGQGDGICIRTCEEGGSRTILIDGGSSSRKGIGEYVIVPFLKYHGVSKIDYCIMTHDDLDHCSGLLELLGQSDAPGGIRIGRIGMPSVAAERKGETYVKIEKLAALKSIPVTYLHRGMTYSCGKLELTCLHPEINADYEDANEYSAVMLLTYGQFSAVLTGDLEGEGESDLLDYLGEKKIKADVLKTAHHGSRNGTSERFLAGISARIALISVGQGNAYGHPDPATTERIREAGMEIYDTRRDGQISVKTDGRGKYSVETFSDNTR